MGDIDPSFIANPTRMTRHSESEESAAVKQLKETIRERDRRIEELEAELAKLRAVEDMKDAGN